LELVVSTTSEVLFVFTVDDDGTRVDDDEDDDDDEVVCNDPCAAAFVASRRLQSAECFVACPPSRQALQPGVGTANLGGRPPAREDGSTVGAIAEDDDDDGNGVGDKMSALLGSSSSSFSSSAGAFTSSLLSSFSSSLGTERPALEYENGTEDPAGAAPEGNDDDSGCGFKGPCMLGGSTGNGVEVGSPYVSGASVGFVGVAVIKRNIDDDN
jgi:hypothetical protein